MGRAGRVVGAPGDASLGTSSGSLRSARRILCATSSGRARAVQSAIRDRLGVHVGVDLARIDGQRPDRTLGELDRPDRARWSRAALETPYGPQPRHAVVPASEVMLEVQPSPPQRHGPCHCAAQAEGADQVHGHVLLQLLGGRVEEQPEWERPQRAGCVDQDVDGAHQLRGRPASGPLRPAPPRRRPARGPPIPRPAATPPPPPPPRWSGTPHHREPARARARPSAAPPADRRSPAPRFLSAPSLVLLAMDRTVSCRWHSGLSSSVPAGWSAVTRRHGRFHPGPPGRQHPGPARARAGSRRPRMLSPRRAGMNRPCRRDNRAPACWHGGRQAGMPAARDRPVHCEEDERWSREEARRW